MHDTISPQPRVLVNPAGTEEFYTTWQFSQGVRVGKTIWTAGQIGVDGDGRFGTSLEEQARLAFANLRTVLQAAGSSLNDVVDLVTYHLAMDDLPRFAAVKAEFFTQNYPPWTVVGVTALALPELLVEVKAVAVVGSGLPQSKEPSSP
jgi:enamine deaminase RidA (YjgF/YER057c/UK114 family)